jgi:hypothetical protein
MTGELRTRVRELLAALAASDPACKRFGAAQHRYELAPPVTDVELGQIEDRLAGASLPEDYLDYVTRLSAGGVGPYYGILRADRAAAYPIEAPAGVSAWRRALPVAHLGCGYLAVLPLDGAARGQIWIDARGADLVAPIRASFTAFYLDWIDRVAHSRWLDGFVAPGRCALQAALSGYLATWEQRLGLPPGTLDGESLREALGQLGPGAIVIAADGAGPVFEANEPVDPCITCARAVEALADAGLRGDVVAPGLAPRPARLP